MPADGKQGGRGQPLGGDDTQAGAQKIRMSYVSPQKALGKRVTRQRDKQGPAVGQAWEAEGGGCGRGQRVRWEQFKMRLERDGSQNLQGCWQPA